MEIYREDKTLYIVPNCDLTASHVEELRDGILNKLRSEESLESIVFDVKGIEVVDSLGVNLIIGTYRHAESQSIQFEVINANEKFMKISDFFQFENFFSVTPEQTQS